MDASQNIVKYRILCRCNIKKFSGGNTGVNNSGVVSGTVYKIISKRSGKAFDVSNESFDNGASVHLWEYLGHDNQLWTIETPSAVVTATVMEEIEDGTDFTQEFVITVGPGQQVTTGCHHQHIERKL